MKRTHAPDPTAKPAGACVAVSAVDTCVASLGGEAASDHVGVAGDAGMIADPRQLGLLG